MTGARTFVLALALATSACGESERSDPTPAEPTTGAEQTAVEASAVAAQPAEPSEHAEPAEPVGAAEPEQSSTAPCELTAVYFAYDSTSLDAAGRAVIERDVECLRSRGIERVVLTGFTDDEGTSEYAMNEAERYAMAVRAWLVELGFDRAHIAIRSMGEEQAVGTDAESRARDRRVELSAE